MAHRRKSPSRSEKSLVDDILQRGERGERALLIALLEDAVAGCLKGSAEDSKWIFGVPLGGPGFDFPEVIEYLQLDPQDIQELIREQFDKKGIPQIQGDIFHGFSQRKDW